MGIVSWLVLGLIVGALANTFVRGSFPGATLGMIVGGVAGAFLGGAIFSLIAGRGVTGFDLVSLVVAFIGASLLLVLLRWVGHAEPRPTPRPRT
jgi:uncharacterized membrane protein YeaQ/YmgE (transglycosylase-associated protein family)